MPKKVKKIIFPGTALIVSSYISFLFAFGVIIGYFGTNLFCKKYIHTGKINSVTFNFGQWKIHLHHWIMGISTILAIYLTGFFSFVPILCIGTLSGLALHDLHTDKKWYKVIYKK